jgi:hypothetical protein
MTHFVSIKLADGKRRLVNVADIRYVDTTDDKDNVIIYWYGTLEMPLIVNETYSDMLTKLNHYVPRRKKVLENL